ncbi:MAG TPA: hypothetical protein VFV98_04640, partial [Vicinamibacterales bacterium]|nr:hypothetical protein [Vicinamibacterales bacterium]
MLRPPMLDRSGTLDSGRHRFAIEAVELVGHLQTDAPAAYVPVSHDASLKTAFDRRALTRSPRFAPAISWSAPPMMAAMARWRWSPRCGPRKAA